MAMCVGTANPLVIEFVGDTRLESRLLDTGGSCRGGEERSCLNW